MRSNVTVERHAAVPGSSRLVYPNSSIPSDDRRRRRLVSAPTQVSRRTRRPHPKARDRHPIRLVGLLRNPRMLASNQDPTPLRAHYGQGSVLSGALIDRLLRFQGPAQGRGLPIATPQCLTRAAADHSYLYKQAVRRALRDREPRHSWPSTRHLDDIAHSTNKTAWSRVSGHVSYLSAPSRVAQEYRSPDRRRAAGPATPTQMVQSPSLPRVTNVKVERHAAAQAQTKLLYPHPSTPSGT